MKRALKGLRFLERANDGHPVHLGKILAMTYGRVGKRRRQLVAQLMLESPPTESTTMICDQGPVLGNQLKALVISQMNCPNKSLKGDKLSLKPKIPEFNTWGRPIPVNRARNLKTEWYADLLDIIMPPLPEVEWDRLRGLASGLISWDGPVPRRKIVSTGVGIISVSGHSEPGIGVGRIGTLCKSDDSITDNRLVGWQDDTSSPGTRVYDPISISVESFQHSKAEPRRRLNTNPHELTPRFMRRRWAEVFALCPTMTWDSVQSNWNVKWGFMQIKDKSANLGPVVFKGLFEGVDDNGKCFQSSPGHGKK